MSKPEFPNLLSPGFHHFTLDDLPSIFVIPFANSLRRPMLVAGLRKFATEVAALGLRGELWFDGSFVCEKNEPDDIDLVVIVDPHSLEQLGAEQYDLVERVFHNPTAKALYGCDVYFAVSSDIGSVSYWRGWYGFKRDGKTAKGIGFISL